ncbi:DUF6191 domain-containing protein [Streptomyces sp. SID14446]|uniref:DUF6191 domain-containing protein n=2 Tax=unclassified Streptomyces TaxID=2593676 RepID=UPI001EF23066|nr:DUF6191 domain-containing protein [Streptomyces sp. SID14446]
MFEELFAPGRKHTNDERKRLELSRVDLNDGDPGRGPIDLTSGKVVVRAPRHDEDAETDTSAEKDPAAAQDQKVPGAKDATPDQEAALAKDATQDQEAAPAKDAAQDQNTDPDPDPDPDPDRDAAPEDPGPPQAS